MPTAHISSQKDTLVKFLKNTFQSQRKKHGIIAVSGGIDSAVSLTLLCCAIGPEYVYPLFLPYGDQSIVDSKLIAQWNKIPVKNWKTVNIKPMVDAFANELAASGLRKGNIMARARMIVVFDTAKKLDGLVCGTENKSEHYLGYFTRFGDAASDIEPISTLYKTQVQEMATFLGLPEIFTTKAPSAGLWEGQTDEKEMGFSYEDADRAVAVILGESKESIDPTILNKVKALMDSQAFKLKVPYKLSWS